MIRSIITLILTGLTLATAHAAVDANKASQAELESIKGLGPSMSARIVDERKQGQYKDWSDLVTRVKGIGDGNAARFSANGLTVGTASYVGKSPSAPKNAAAPAAKTPAASTPKAADGKAMPADAKAPADAKK